MEIMETTQERTVRKATLEVPEEVLQADLQRYVNKAIEFGASDAKIIPADWVIVDERVRLKCYVPKCYAYGQSPYCPPNTPEPEFIRKALSRFKWAILVKHDVMPVEDFTGKGWAKAHSKHHRKIFEIIGKLESLASIEGYPLATGFAAGSCLHELCDGTGCRMINNGTCPHNLRARPSMEAVGIDVYNLAARVGWDIYACHVPAGTPVPSAMSVGILFVY